MAQSDNYDRPTYPLKQIQDLVRLRQYTVMGRAESDARDLGLLAALPDCICSLSEKHIRFGGNFYKSSEAKRPPADAKGLWHDVYKTIFEEVALYIKVQLGRNGKAVVISFHENTDSGDNG